MNRRNMWGLLVILLVVVASAGVIYLQANKQLNATDGKSALRLGMDLQGGVMLVMEVLDPPSGALTADIVEDAKIAMERRIDQLGVVEPQIERLSGENWRRINVSLPGITDLQQALDVIGTQGMLSFKLEGVTVMSGGDILENATAGYSGNNGTSPAVHLKLSSRYAKEFEEITGGNIGRTLEIYLDDEVVVSGQIQSSIPSGECEISGGDMTLQMATSTAAILRGGVLPAPVEHKETRFVDPTLGSDITRTSMIAGLIGIIAVFLFLIIVYRVPGLMASIALIIYAMLVLAVYMLIGATLSLSAIAGFILSLGMAVDANVIIFERIKEELRQGKRLSGAIDAGFHKAFSAIFDGNITTLLTAVILFYFGSSKVKGFSVTLAIGIVVSMFTAIVITRILMNLLASNKTNVGPEYFGGGKRA